MKHAFILFGILIALWLGNSGLYTPLSLTLGLLSVIAVVWLCRRMDIIDHESQPAHLLRRLPAYYAWLGVQLVRSNLDVVVCICRGNSAISPCVATLPVTQRTGIGKVIYANSITLTPGTVALDLGQGHVMVHALTAEGMDALKSGEMARRVNRLET
jgi:multicomponent Na+:H+ antiporter subunit E